MNRAWLTDAVKWAGEATEGAEDKWTVAGQARPEFEAEAWTQVARSERAASTAWAEAERRNREYVALHPDGLMGKADGRLVSESIRAKRAIVSANARSEERWTALAEWAANAAARGTAGRGHDGEVWAAAWRWAAAEARAAGARMSAREVGGLARSLEQTKKFCEEICAKSGSGNAANAASGRRTGMDMAAKAAGFERAAAEAERAAAEAERAAGGAAAAYEQAAKSGRQEAAPGWGEFNMWADDG